MKSASSVSEVLLGGDNVRSFPTTLPSRRSASNYRGKRSYSVGHNGDRPGDVRSILAGRFMHMLRAHDRARMKILATHPTHAR